MLDETYLANGVVLGKPPDLSFSLFSRSLMIRADFWFPDKIPISMDLKVVIAQLRERISLIDETIASLTRLQEHGLRQPLTDSGKKSGNQPMNEEHRQKHAEMMAKYWAERRRKRQMTKVNPKQCPGSYRVSLP